MPDPFSRLIDGRPLGELKLGELDPLSVKKHAKAQRYIELTAEARLRSPESSEEVQRYQRLSEDVVKDALLLDKIIEYVEQEGTQRRH
jgi:hypothetical protein